MLIVCWSAKGGSGTTVVAAALSLLLAAQHPAGAIALDLAGDLGAALGLPEASGPGVSDWLAAEPPPARGALLALAGNAGAGVRLIGRGAGAAGLPPPHDLVWGRLAHELTDCSVPIVVDAGCSPPPVALRTAAAASLLIIRPCYLALRRAAAVSPEAATGVVVVAEPGRALGARDVAAALHLPVVAEVPLDPAVARAVDAGLLLGRLPSTIARALRNAA